MVRKPEMNDVGPSSVAARLDRFDATYARIIVPIGGKPAKVIVPEGDDDRGAMKSPPGSKRTKAAKGQEGEESRTTPFTPVGIGEPMKITLEQLYVGNTTRLEGELLVVSVAKDPEDTAEASVSFHWWGEKVKSRTHPNMADGSAGSSIMYYSPAEVATKLEISVRLKFDYFPEDVVKAWRKAVLDIGRLPILLGGIAFGPGGTAASNAVVGVADAGSDLIVNLLDRAIDGSGGVQMGGDLTIAHPGRTEAKAGYLVLAPDDYEVKSKGAGGSSVLTGYASNDKYDSGNESASAESIEIDGRDFYVSNLDGRLKHASDGKWVDGKKYRQGDTVEGPWHYAVILLNGASDPDLKKWKPASVTADLAAKFLNRPRDSALPDLTEKVFSSYSDAVLISRAADLEKEIQAATASIKDAESGQKPEEMEKLERIKALLEKQLTALVDAIEDDKLKDLVTGK